LDHLSNPLLHRPLNNVGPNPLEEELEALDLPEPGPRVFSRKKISHKDDVPPPTDNRNPLAELLDLDHHIPLSDEDHHLGLNPLAHLSGSALHVPVANDTTELPIRGVDTLASLFANALHEKNQESLSKQSDFVDPATYHHKIIHPESVEIHHVTPPKTHHVVHNKIHHAEVTHKRGNLIHKKVHHKRLRHHKVIHTPGKHTVTRVHPFTLGSFGFPLHLNDIDEEEPL
jgi:hypothetical protein